MPRAPPPYATFTALLIWHGFKVLTESTRRSGDGNLFHARGAATANERSPSDDMVRGTATEPDVADLTPALAVAAADGVIRSAK